MGKVKNNSRKNNPTKMKTFKNNKKLSIKHIFQHALKNKIIDDVVLEMMNDTASYGTLFKEIKTFYEKENKVPNKQTIKSIVDGEIDDISSSEIKLMLNTDEYEALDNKWFSSEFEKQYKIYELKLKLYKDIENYRNLTYDELVEKGVINPINENDDDDDDNDTDLMNTPFIEDEVYDNSPDFIKKLVSYYDDKREKDVFFTGFISTISSVFNNTYFLYDKHKIYPNLFTFVVAPASSGKGKMADSEKLLYKYEDRLYNEYKNEYKQLDGDIDDIVDLIAKDPIIPGNTSTAALIQTLDNQDGEGLMFNTEADNLVNANKQDWGDYSYLLRESFQNEAIRKQRLRTKQNLNSYKQYIPVSKLAVCLSGTADQVVKLIKTTQNGLFSRFLYYVFEKPIKWKQNLFDDIDVVNIFENEMGEKVLEMIEFFNKDTQIKFTKKQKTQFNKLFDESLQDRISFNNKNIKDSIYRNGARFIKIAMIFTLIDFFENRKVTDSCPDDIYVKDYIFNISKSLMLKTYNKHQELIFNNLHKFEVKDFIKNPIEKIYENLKDTFKRNDFINKVVERGKTKESAAKAVTRILNKRKKMGKIIQIDRHTWKKLDDETN